jgi:hypothetical protein
MMKTAKQHALMILLAVPLLCSGCLKCEVILDIQKDGKGSIEASYSVSENAVAQLNSMVKLSKQLNQMSADSAKKDLKDPELLLFLDPDEKKIRARLAEYKKFGLEIDKLRVKTRNSWRSVDLRLEFDDLAEVAKADFFSEIGFSLYKRKSGDYVFFRQNFNAGNPNAAIVKDPSAQRLISPILEGFEVTVKVHTPTRVVDTNADSSGLTSATWTFRQDKDPQSFQKLQNQEYIILMDGSGISIPDIKIVKKEGSEAK